MQRYFVDDSSIDSGQSEVRITGDDVSHISKVMRSSAGDHLICCNSQGACFLVEVKQIEKEQVVCEIVEELAEERELPISVWIAQSLPKGDKMEWVIQKGTELGAVQFIPFSSSRTIVQWDQKKEQRRIGRWMKIAKEAAEQSHRKRLPKVEAAHSWKQALGLAKQVDLALLAYENEQTTSLYEKILTLPAGKTVLLMIGPEGGFSDQEVEEAIANGFQTISLGKRILRTETAALVGLAYLSFYYEQMQTS
ncbi:hypothetical protein BEP19_06105 [Ammoniphilus oxalaticus]|uniref:Ribosomal RNA small subunit methyltransferase E n=1 Tax=Ammoniphilus oxalaticus TaxID=66863 RepID=A0A419SJ61_9BACL|nr:16S rRNA (uracil(1498)-N(3))-methyltransferase [Ammoniphilus oxalaticus]RKD23990.1 hypothetical protein BEP19_06105 [Ammoniphilus oxalaticus]